MLISSTDAASVSVFSCSSGERVDDIVAQRQGAMRCAWSANGAYSATAQETGLIQIFTLSPPAPTPGRIIPLSITGLSPDDQTATPILYPGGKLVALGRSCCLGPGDIKTGSRVLHIATGEPAGPVLDAAGAILSAVFIPDGRVLALLPAAPAADRSGTQFLPDGQAGNLRLWHWQDGTRLGDPISMPSEPRSIVIRDGIAHIWCGGGHVVAVDLETRRVTPLFQPRSGYRNSMLTSEGSAIAPTAARSSHGCRET